MSESLGSVTIVGIGPGAREHTTPAALGAIARADVVVGYTTYVKLVADLLVGKEVIRTGMTEEIARARAAVDAARAGRVVAVISSGDAGVYGMGSLVHQVVSDAGLSFDEVPVAMIPGVTALASCGSLVGAPFGHDFCAISLSDLLTPWPVIARRLEAAAVGDFVVALYNPASGRRQRQIVEARAILGRHRASTTPVALVKSAYRKKQTVVHTDLDGMLEYEIGMLTTVIVGSSQTRRHDGRIYTPRGYDAKYDASGVVREGQTPGRSLVLAEEPS